MGITDFLIRNLELILVLIITTAMGIVIYLNLSNLLVIYSASSINDKVLNFCGIITGFLLTSYAILFGLFPNLSKEYSKTRYFKSVNKTFFIAILMAIILVGESFLLNFVNNSLLIFIQLFLLTFLILLSILLSIYLYLLLEKIRAS